MNGCGKVLATLYLGKLGGLNRMGYTGTSGHKECQLAQKVIWKAFSDGVLTIAAGNTPRRELYKPGNCNCHGGSIILIGGFKRVLGILNIDTRSCKGGYM